jgi:hypothetical protein
MKRRVRESGDQNSLREIFTRLISHVTGKLYTTAVKGLAASTELLGARTKLVEVVPEWK